MVRPNVIFVENLPAEGKVFPFQVSREEANGFLSSAAPAETQAVSAVSGEARAYRSGRDVFVLGRLHARVRYECVRCLEPFEEELSAEFHRVFSASEEYGSGEVELHAEDMDVEAIEGGAIDLGRIAEEELSLALKAHPVCRETCRGLCPVCGTNLNAEECRCSEEPTDPRLAVLKTLIEKK